jgi:hypothetical protein
MSRLRSGGLFRTLVRTACVLAVVLAGAQANAQTGIKATRHNLSSSNTTIAGANKVSDTTEVCVFCHTPHQSNTTAQAPLWNKQTTATGSYTTYNSTNSSTLDGEVLSVGSVSLACLSCHDGTQAMDNIINAPGSGQLDPTGGGVDGLNWTWSATTRVDATGKLLGVAKLGTNLVDDHPIGIAYCGGGPNAASPTAPCIDRDFVPPSNASINGTQVFWVNTDGGNPNREKTDMILYNRTFFQNVNGQGAGSGPSVECASCHDPHVSEGASAANGQVAGATFLRISNAGSAVCLACHVK